MKTRFCSDNVLRHSVFVGQVSRPATAPVYSSQMCSCLLHVHAMIPARSISSNCVKNCVLRRKCDEHQGVAIVHCNLC